MMAADRGSPRCSVCGDPLRDERGCCRCELRDPVACDSCGPGSSAAVRSCLTCLASFCGTHLDQHQELHGRGRHQLTAAVDLRDRICSQHGRLTEVYCRTDRRCVCAMCALQEHRGHDTAAASDERAHRQRKLMETRAKFLQKIRDRHKDFTDLTRVEEMLSNFMRNLQVQHSAQAALTETEWIFSQVISSIQKTRCRVKELISDQQRAELSRIEGAQEKVQQKMADMRAKVADIDQFITTEDHVYFLQNYPSDCEESSSEETEGLSCVSPNPGVLFRRVTMLVSEMQERLMDITSETELKITSDEEDQREADVEIIFECKPTADQADLASRLMLPHTFFCYRNQPGYISDEDDDEDFQAAVQALKGKLYPDPDPTSIRWASVYACSGSIW